MLLLIITILLVLIISGLCSGIEAALLSVSPIRIQNLNTGKKVKSSAKVLKTIKNKITRPLAAIVILNNLANIVGSIIVGVLVVKALGNHWLGFISGLLTLMVIIFSEIIPKTIGERFNEPIALLASIPVLFLTYLFFPVIWGIEKLVWPITRGQKEFTTNESEIRLLARIGHQEGTIEKEESQMIQRIFLLNDKKASDLMTPRTVMTCLHFDRLLGDERNKIITSPHSRIVVIGENRDNIKGIAMKKDLLEALLNGKEDRQIADFALPVSFVQETHRADSLLVHFRQTRQHLAIVLDEYGGVSGVVSLEDVLEVITGEIVDESDRIIDLQEYARQRAKVKKKVNTRLLRNKD